jgi:hypothetical protein
LQRWMQREARRLHRLKLGGNAVTWRGPRPHHAIVLTRRPSKPRAQMYFQALFEMILSSLLHRLSRTMVLKSRPAHQPRRLKPRSRSVPGQAPAPSKEKPIRKIPIST